MSMRLTFHTLGLIGFVVTLSACGANETGQTATTNTADRAVTSDAVQTVAKLTLDPSPEAALHAACTDQITAKMPDPTAANVTYAPLPGSDGYEATVALKTQSGGDPMMFTYSCVPTENGEVETKRVAD